MVGALQKENVHFIALSTQGTSSNKMPVWQAGATYAKMIRSHLKNILREILFHSLKLQRVPLFLISNMIVFSKHYCYWYTFFKSNNIKININPFDVNRMTIGMHLALERNNGVSISYQWS